MTEDELRNKYNDWLYSLVSPEKGLAGNTALMAFTVLRSVEFYELVPHDVNREIDGKQLREEFWTELEDPSVAYLLDGPCTVAEMMIALARDLSFMMDGFVMDSSVVRWFWEMVRNLDIFRCMDPVEKVRKMVERDYRTDGKGGLFPLASPRCDQRKIEIWAQANEYMLENYYW